MFDFHEKRRIRGYIYSKYTVVIILLLIVWLSVSVFERYKVERTTAEKLQTKEAELVELQNRAELLQSKVERLNNTRGIEEEIRNRFDVAKEGEQVVVVIDDDSEAETDLESLSKPPGTSEQTIKKSFWSWLPLVE